MIVLHQCSHCYERLGRACAVLLLPLVLVVSACGSTSSGDERGEDDAVTAAPTADDGGTNTQANGTTAAGPAGTGTTPAVATAAGGSTSTGDSQAEAPLRGVTDDQINLGFIYTTGGAELAAALGTEGDEGNTLGQVEAAVDAVNADGGIAGRQINLLSYEFRAGDAIDSQLQAACEYFTQDNATTAVSSALAGMTTGEVLYDCLASAGVLYIDAALAGDRAAFARFPGLAYAPATMTADRSVEATVDALAEEGWFGEDAVVGVHAVDSPHWRRVVEETLAPKLESMGLSIAEEMYFPIGTSGTDNLDAYGSATLRFKSAGVTNVIDVGNHPLIFMGAADAQGWHPKWSIYSDIAPANWVAAAPAGQLDGLMGIGWAPSYDVLPAERSEPVTAAETECADAMRDGGQDPAPVIAWQMQLNSCSAVFFLRDVLGEADEMTVEGFAETVKELGTGHVSPSTWATDFSSGRPDGVASYRLLGYVESCGCVRYLSDLQPAS